MTRGEVKQRAIRKNHRTVFPSSWLIFDTESIKESVGETERHRFRLSWGCYSESRPGRDSPSETWKSHYKPWPLCAWIESLARDNRPLWLFSHNLFFDLQLAQFFEYMPLNGWILDFHYDKGLNYILVVKKGKRVIKGISTTNYFDLPLEVIGERLGMPKGKVDFDTVTEGELLAYCRRDVEVLKLALEEYMGFLKDHDLGQFAMTRAAQSMNAYRHRFMTHKIYTHKINEVVDLETEAYMGGRVECFHIGDVPDGPFLSLDVNSMYPHVMRQYSFPCRFDSYHESISVDALNDLLPGRCAVAEVLLETPEPHYSIRRGEKIIFPVGRFRAALCTRGLNFALARNHIRGVIEVAFYDPAPIFRSYVDYFAGLKAQFEKDGNQVYRWFVKYFLNSLYGKFAQFAPLTDSWVETGPPLTYRMPYVDEVTGERGIEYKLMNRVIREMGREVGKNSLVAVAAHITEDARLLLDSIIRGIGRDRVIYCDTDSVKIRAADKKFVTHKIDPVELGALKIDETYERMTIYGPKSFVTEGKRVFKGVPKRSTKIGDLAFRYLSFQRQATHMKKGITDYFEVVPVEKEIRPNYDKGIVTTSGRVLPLTLREF